MIKPPEPGDVENDLGHHGATDQDRHRDADHGDHRHERIPKRVDPHDGSLRHALRARGPDVVLLERFQHARSADARDQRRLVESERDGRQHHVPERRHRVYQDGRVAGRRQPAKAHREQIDEVQREPEARDADAQERGQHQRAVPQRALIGGGDDPRRHADYDRDEQRRKGQYQGRLGALQEGRHHWPVEEIGLSEVAAQDARVELEKLLVQGTVEAEGLARRLDLRRGRVRAQHDAHRVAGDQVNEQEDDGDDDRQHRHERQEPSNQVRRHGG